VVAEAADLAGGLVSAPQERSVTVGGFSCRVWEKGTGERLGFLAGLGGLVRWTPFLDRLAERRRVIVPSLPGFPGGHGHERLDTLVDWVTATLDLLEAAGLDGADLVGASVGGALAAEVAACSHATVRKLALLAPLGAYDPELPPADPWAVRDENLASLLCAQPEHLVAHVRPPEGADGLEHMIVLARASEAAARLLWPTMDTGIEKRLHRIRAPTLLLWGAEDRVVAPAYAERIARGIGAHARAQVLASAGHRLDLDAPDAAALAVLAFLG
jgi:pimeloyl-ACP methyl ester carboxylesterase